LNRSASFRASAKTWWARGVKSLIIAFPKPGPLPDLVESRCDTGTSTFTIKGKKHRILR
jgi:hypothetical protein